MRGRIAVGLVALALAAPAAGAPAKAPGRLIDQFAGPPAAAAPAKPVAERHTALLSLQGGMGLLVAPQAETYLRRLTDKLLAGWPQPAPAVRVHLTSNTQYRAEALGSGTIYVSAGVLQQAESEDEVAALLAHELSHLLLAHFSDTPVFGAQRKLATLALLGMMSRDEKAAAGNASGLSGVALGTVIADGVAQNVLQNSWNREQEARADQLASDLVVKAGYSPRGLLDVLQRLPRPAAEKKARWFTPDQQTGVPMFGLDPLKQALGKLGAQLTSSHPDLAARQRALGDYVRREYRADAGKPLADAALVAARQGWQREVEAPQLAAEAIAALDEGRRSEAAARLAPALASPAAGSFHVQWALQLLDLQRGNDEAVSDRLATLTQAPDTPLWLNIELAKAHIRKREFDDAEAAIARIRTVHGDQPFLYPLQIHLYTAADRKVEALAIQALCLKHLDGDLSKACTDARTQLQ